MRALKECNVVVETWLCEQVASSYDALQADPDRAPSAEAVFDEIRARHAQRVKGGT